MYCLNRFCEAGTEVALDSWLDHHEFYSCRGLTLLGLGLGTAAILANTSLDEDYQAWHHRQFGNDRLADSVMWLGDGRIMIPIFAVAAVADGCTSPRDPDVASLSRNASQTKCGYRSIILRV